MENIKFYLGAGVSAAALAVVLTLGAAAIGWLVGSNVLAAVLAMIVSSLLIIGFGDVQIPWIATMIVGLSWVFADSLLGWLGISGVSAYITMAVVYLILGSTKGQTREQVIYSGAGPVLGAILGILLYAVILPQQAAQSVDEAVISAMMISAARSVQRAAEALKI